jgi:hypothetical protein
MIDVADQKRFEIAALFAIGPVLSLRCLRCRRWAVHMDDPRLLADLNRRAGEHVELCSD